MNTDIFAKNQQGYFQIKNFNFEAVQSFTCLGSLINVNDDNSAKIKKRILMGNKGFYGPKRQFRAQFLSIKNKIKLYKTLIRPVLHMVLKHGYYHTLTKLF